MVMVVCVTAELRTYFIGPWYKDAPVQFYNIGDALGLKAEANCPPKLYILVIEKKNQEEKIMGAKDQPQEAKRESVPNPNPNPNHNPTPYQNSLSETQFLSWKRQKVHSSLSLSLSLFIL